MISAEYNITQCNSTVRHICHAVIVHYDICVMVELCSMTLLSWCNFEWGG